MAQSPPYREEQLYCWQEGEAEIEFIRSIETAVIPIEVKSGNRTKSRSLGEFISKYRPPFAIRSSAKPMSFYANKNVLKFTPIVGALEIRHEHRLILRKPEIQKQKNE